MKHQVLYVVLQERRRLRKMRKIHILYEFCTNFIRKSMPQSMIWPDYPFYSPDLNPLENIWGWLKNQVNRETPTTIEMLKKCIKKHWKLFNSDFLAFYFNSMPERMNCLIENNGYKINYKLCISYSSCYQTYISHK